MIKTDIKLPLKYRSEDILSAIKERLPIELEEIKEYRLVKRTLDVSDKQKIHYKATVAIACSEEREQGLLKMRKTVFTYELPSFELPVSRLSSRPIIIGAGPAGLFCALALAESGARPILFERGLAVEERTEKVKLFATLGLLDSECNVQFGEGGAGTYSDGKLKVGGMDKYKYKILNEFINAGADEDILYSTSAHVGTDRLSKIIKALREKIISLGGEMHFGAKLVEIKTKDNKIVGCVIEKDGERKEFITDTLVMAIGHSARDSFELLLKNGAKLIPRGFGIGVRIEHPREYINTIVYGKDYPSDIETASYHLVTHLDNGRSVYSFCMCPGGTVVPAASDEGGIVTNGMSEHLRDGENSNAAFLVSVTPEDFGSPDPLAGVDFQRKIERKAYRATGSYKAPTQTTVSLLTGEKSTFHDSVKPSYPIGTENIPSTDYLPEFVTDSLRAAVPDFDAWLPGFYYPGAAITGPETRTTSPVRVLRTETFEAVGIKGLYPAGEGAGYAGGIVSSARDGLMIAEAVLAK